MILDFEKWKEIFAYFQEQINRIEGNLQLKDLLIGENIEAITVLKPILGYWTEHHRHRLAKKTESQ